MKYVACTVAAVIGLGAPKTFTAMWTSGVPLPCVNGGFLGWLPVNIEGVWQGIFCCLTAYRMLGQAMPIVGLTPDCGL
jgi:hypothetical protein